MINIYIKMNNQKSLIKWLFKTPMMINVYIKFFVFNNNLLTENIIKYEELLSKWYDIQWYLLHCKEYKWNIY